MFIVCRVFMCFFIVLACVVAKKKYANLDLTTYILKSFKKIDVNNESILFLFVVFFFTIVQSHNWVWVDGTLIFLAYCCKIIRKDFKCFLFFMSWYKSENEKISVMNAVIHTEKMEREISYVYIIYRVILLPWFSSSSIYLKIWRLQCYPITVFSISACAKKSITRWWLYNRASLHRHRTIAPSPSHSRTFASSFLWPKHNGAMVNGDVTIPLLGIHGHWVVRVL